MNNRNSRLLEKAFFEAARGDWLFTAPNPRVGAIALRDGHIVGRGHHAQFGGPHAEEAALRDAEAWDLDAQKAIPGVVDEMIVTLEPCSSTQGKKRPPCTQSLLDAGVERITVGALDPDPRHAGSGLELLKNAGVSVDCTFVEIGQPQFEKQNRAFLQGLASPELPWVLLKWASSIDGKTATDEGISKWITGPESREEVHQLRALGQATMAAKGTILADDPSLTARPNGEALKHQPLRVMMGCDVAISKDAQLMKGSGPRLWVIEANAKAPVEQDPCLRVERLPSGLDLHATLKSLRTEYGVKRLFVEGGSQLHGSFLAAGLAHAIVRYEAPILIGGHHGACAGPSFSSPRSAIRLSNEERAELGHDLRRAFLFEPLAKD